MPDRPIQRRLIDLGFVAIAAIAMGTFVGAANFSDYGPLVPLDVGTVVIGVSLLAGVALGFRATDEDPQALILYAFASSLGAIAIVTLTVFAPVLAGVVESLNDLGSAGSARLAFIFTALFIVPMHIVGSVVGYALKDFLAPAQFGRERDADDR